MAPKAPLARLALAGFGMWISTQGFSLKQATFFAKARLDSAHDHL